MDGNISIYNIYIIFELYAKYGNSKKKKTGLPFGKKKKGAAAEAAAAPKVTGREPIETGINIPDFRIYRLITRDILDCCKGLYYDTATDTFAIYIYLVILLG